MNMGWLLGTVLDFRNKQAVQQQQAGCSAAVHRRGRALQGTTCPVLDLSMCRWADWCVLARHSCCTGAMSIVQV